MESKAPYLQLVQRDGIPTAAGQAYVALGEDAPGGIGSASWAWDGRCLVARSCRYGLRPIFYCAETDRISLSFSIAQLLQLGIPDELDLVALGVFLRFGSFVGEDTPFRAIRCLPPDGTLRWDGALSLSGGYVEIAPRPLDHATAVAEYNARFRRAVERCAGPSSIVPLSGGRDSRHIAFETHRLGRLQRCITLRYPPPKPDEDVAIAAMVARALRVPHVVLPQSGDRLENERTAILRSNFAAACHEWMMPLRGYLALGSPAVTASGFDNPVLDGLAGDVLSNGLFLTPALLELYRKGRLPEVADRLFGLVPSRLPYLAEPKLLPVEEARARMVVELERHAHAANPVASFFFWNRTRRSIAQAPFGVLGDWPVRCPYLDPEVFNLLLGLPPELFLAHRFHTDAIEAAFPQFSMLPYETKRLPPVTARAHFRQHARSGLARLWQGRSPLLNRRYCAPRLGFDAASGSQRFLWVGHACAYLDLLEEVRPHEAKPRSSRFGLPAGTHQGDELGAAAAID